MHLENTLKERSLRLVTFENLISDEDLTWTNTKDKEKKYKDNNKNMSWLVNLWTCWHFRQLRTWIHDNHCDMTIKSGTGQNLQFFWCFHHFPLLKSQIKYHRVKFLTCDNHFRCLLLHQGSDTWGLKSWDEICLEFWSKVIFFHHPADSWCKTSIRNLLLMSHTFLSQSSREPFFRNKFYIDFHFGQFWCWTLQCIWSSDE